MKVIAVIVTYNRKNFLLECLTALLEQTYSLQEIVILDNASTDGTREALEESRLLNNEVLKYIRLETNTGGAGGFYYGSKQAYTDGADWIWMMDDDCIPSKTALEELINAAGIVDAGFLCSAVYDVNDDPCSNNKPSIDFLSPWFKYVESGIVQIRRATFVSYFVPRLAVEQCGLPYKNLFIWGDDDEYSYRITRYFKPGYLAGKSKVVHKISNDSSPWDGAQTGRIKNLHFLVRNSLLNAKEYYSFNGRLKCRLNYLRMFFRIAFSKRKKKILKLSQIIKGFWEYHIGSYDRKAFKQRFTNHLS